MHQFVDRATGRPMSERLFGDRIVGFLYSETREHAPALFRALTTERVTALLGYLQFDVPLAASLLGNRRFLASCGVDLRECLDPPESLDTPRKVFERRIRYWDCRPTPSEEDVVVSPADARVLVGSLTETSALYLKGKFFDLDELLGPHRPRWRRAFARGDWAIFRLTPDKYHYNHTPVAGRVVDRYELGGAFHACNPGAVVQLVTPFSKNRRVVTVFDTDVPGGTRVGLVAMVEVVAMMIGDVEQRYSASRYDDPTPLEPGRTVVRGAPKSLYRPGSSTDVLLFEPGRIDFSDDLVRNRVRTDVRSRFTQAFGRPVAETEVRVRSTIGRRRPRQGARR